MIPEAAIQKIIIDGLRQIRRDLRVVDSVFRHLTQKQISEIKKFISETPIDFSINFPRADVKVPSMALVLKNESESQAFLGNVMSVAPVADTPDPELTYDTLGGHGASTTDLRGLPKKVVGPLRVASVSGSKVFFHEDTIADWEEVFAEVIDGLSLPSLSLYVVQGAGVGQVFEISSLSPDSLDIDGTFEVNLDSSTYVDIRETNNYTAVDGEPSRVYSPSEKATRVGVNYGVTYYLHIMARNPEETIYLFQLLKALFLVNTQELESQGIINLRISGTELAPRTDYLPNDVFTRIMNLEFIYPFYTIVTEDAIKALSVSLTPIDPRTQAKGETQILAEVDLED